MGADARQARERGLDAVWVSDRGGCQLDGAAPPLHALSAVKAEARDTALLGANGCDEPGPGPPCDAHPGLGRGVDRALQASSERM